MKNKKGMTLIEVMVAMLILSIAMIGGVSFFTGAYRLNYSYMENANRIDHALRYVESFKIKKRNQPTYGVFANVGGEGFTVYFLDNEFNDRMDAEPYFYENYFVGDVRIDGELMKYSMSSYYNTNNTNRLGVYRLLGKTSGIKLVNGCIPEEEDKYMLGDFFPNKDYGEIRLSKICEKFPNNTVVLSQHTLGPQLLRYKYNESSRQEEIKEVYILANYNKMANYSRNNKVYSTWNTDRGMYKKTPNTNLNGMLSNPSFSYLYVDIPNFSFKRSSKNPKDVEEDIVFTPTGYSSYIFPYSYFYSNTYDGYGYYTTYSSNMNLIIKNGYIPEDVGTGENTDITKFSFKEYRFYKECPTTSNPNPTQVCSPRTTLTHQYCYIKSPDERYKIEEPNPDYWHGKGLYHKDAKYIATVYETVNGTEKIVNLLYWYKRDGIYASEPNAQIQPHDTATSPFWIQYNNGNVSVNQHRVSNYRRSVYISVWPMKTAAEGFNLINTALTMPDCIDRVKYIKQQAINTGKKVILIPFVQLYAHDDNSTLCEVP